MSHKEDNFKEQFKKALISTAKAISEDYTLDVKKTDKDLNSKKIDFFDVANLSNKNDFIRLRAEVDSGALKKKFSNKELGEMDLYIEVAKQKYSAKVELNPLKDKQARFL